MSAMRETSTVQLTLRKDLAEQAKEVQRTDPEFLSRVVLYGLTRRSIHSRLREQEEKDGTWKYWGKVTLGSDGPFPSSPLSYVVYAEGQG